MPKDYFQFKHFTVHQGKAAMKVSTDACLQAALAVDNWQNKHPLNILDIGAGTGLLSLMLAQNFSSAQIKAVELDEDAYLQTIQNFDSSPWKNNLKVIHSSIQDFHSSQLFDAIICNPPFFNNHLNSSAAQRNLARHDEHLSKQTLAQAIVRLLDNLGSACIMYPVNEWDTWLKVAYDCGLHCYKQVAIQPYFAKAHNRMIGFFAKQMPTAAMQMNTLCIYEDAGKKYSPAFVTLLKDYYLHL